MSELDNIRKQIAALDARILEQIAARLQLARRAGQLKRIQRIAITDSEVEELIIQENIRIGRSLQLPEQLVREITALLIAYATRVQQED